MKIVLVVILSSVVVNVCCYTTSFPEVDFRSNYFTHAPNETEIVAALEKARGINLLKRDINLFSRGYNNRSARCPLSHHHGIRQSGVNRVAERNANDALLAVRILKEDGGYSSNDLERDSVREIFKRLRVFTCPTPKPGNCDFESKFRTADGSCNNINNPSWGMAGSMQRRVLPNDYDDEYGSPRTKGLKRRALPNPRTISNVVHCNPVDAEKLSDSLTLHVMGFGQFLDHDIAITPEQETVEHCCDENSRDDTDNCFNIIIPRSEFELSSIFTPGYCMEFKRSAPLFCPDATSQGRSSRQQTNGLTSFIDASNVYGSSAARQSQLRENGNGFRMKTITVQKQERLPDDQDGNCVLANSEQQCSDAGDPRVNEVPTLTTYHLLFVKEHNRIAQQIEEFYDDKETIFQETRRIVIAVMQKIVYDEFLPSFMSPTGLRKYNLQSSANYAYEANTDPTLTNAFGIAYRLGHTWIPQQMQLFSRSFEQLNNQGFTRNTEDIFMNPDMTYLFDAFNRLAFSLSGRQSPESDNILEEAVRSRLFINREAGISFDLAALNIQRGRDHGLPSYNEYRKWCGLSSLKRKWNKRAGLVDHTEEMQDLLELAGYSSPLDIDLFVGGLTETSVAGGNIGPTFECILGRHFRSLKFGDRYWYQNTDAGFTRGQIAAIQSYSFSKVLCNNYNFKDINCPNAFDSRNARTDCDYIPDLDLSVFNPATPEKPVTPYYYYYNYDGDYYDSNYNYYGYHNYYKKKGVGGNHFGDDDNNSTVTDEELTADIDEEELTADEEELTADIDEEELTADIDEEELTVDDEEFTADDEELTVGEMLKRLIFKLEKNGQKDGQK